MANLFDYLQWRGDLPFEACPLCDVDALVFARLSYIPFEGIVPAGFGTGISLYAAAVVPGVLRLCGHSKGGNLAVYAAAFCEEAIRQRMAKNCKFCAP